MLPSTILDILSACTDIVIWDDIDELLVYAHGVLVPERGLADEKFVYENAEGPPVDGSAMASISDDFRGQVFGCTT